MSFIPHSYIRISKNHPKILELWKSRPLYEKEFIHNIKDLYLENLGMSCKRNGEYKVNLLI